MLPLKERLNEIIAEIERELPLIHGMCGIGPGMNIER